MELIKNIELIHNEGFLNHLDSLIDSAEYIEIFGDGLSGYLQIEKKVCRILQRKHNHSL